MNAAQKAAILRVTSSMQAATHRVLSFTIAPAGKDIMVIATNCFSSHALDSLYCAYAFVGPRGRVSGSKVEKFH